MLQFLFNNLQHLLITLARGLQYFHYVEILYPSDGFSKKFDLQHVHILIFNDMIPVANTKLGIEFEHVNMLKIKKNLNWSDTFDFILPQQKQFFFVSAHAQNFFS